MVFEQPTSVSYSNFMCKDPSLVNILPDLDVIAKQKNVLYLVAYVLSFRDTDYLPCSLFNDCRAIFGQVLHHVYRMLFSICMQSRYGALASSILQIRIFTQWKKFKDVLRDLL